MVFCINVIIVGGRSFRDYELLKKTCNEYFKDKTEIEIVSGVARGADSLGERYALEKGYRIKRFPAKWDEFGKRAGYVRNAEMADYADALIAFWDGESRGTTHMIDLAKKKGLDVIVVNYKKSKE